MVDLIPASTQRIVTSEAPQSRLSGADIAQPYEMMARGLDKLGQGAEAVAVPIAEQAGAKSVTRDADGNIQVAPPPPIFGAAGVAYAREQKMAGLAAYDAKLTQDNIDLRQQYPDNPQGYLAAAQANAEKHAQAAESTLGPVAGAAVRRLAEQKVTETYGGLVAQTSARDQQRAENAITAQMTSASDDAIALARQGADPNSPPMQAALSKYSTLLDEKVNNPRSTYTPEQRDLDLADFQGQIAGARHLYHVDQVYKDQGYQAAADAAKDILTNQNYKLTPAQRQAYFSHSMGEIRANEAIRRQDVGEARAAFRELSTASQLGQRIDPQEVENVRQAFRAANYPAGVAMVDAAFAHRDLHDDFSRQPLGDQTQELNAIRGAATYRPMISAAAQKYGLDPVLLGRQTNQESHFNPREVSRAGARGISQFMPATAARYGVNPDDPASSIEGQAHYMSDLTRRYNGNSGLALAGYNWGEGNVDKWLAEGANPAAMPAETRNYVEAITGQKIQDWTAGKTPMAPVSGPGVSSWLIANRQATVSDGATKAWKQVMDDWQSGKGGMPSADRMGEILDAARSSGNIDLQAKIAHDAALMDQITRVSQLPVDQQVAAETELRRQLAAGTAAPGADLVQKQLEARTKAIQNGLSTNPIATAVANFPDKLRTPAPLDFSSPDNLIAGLKMRAQIAQIAANNWRTGPLSALDAQDVAQTKAALASPDPAVKAGIYGAIAQLPEDVRGATLRSLGGNEPNSMAEAAAGSLMATAPDIASSIFRGQAAMKTDKRFDPTAEEEGKKGYFADLDRSLPATTFTLQDRTDPAGAYATMSAMVRARYADLSAQAGDTSYSRDRLRQAVTDVTGGVLSHNGGSLIAPARGMSQAQLDGVLMGIKDEDMAGVTTLSGQPVTAQYLRQSARLESVGDGKYFVLLGNDPAKPVYAYQGANGEMPTKFMLDLRGRSAAPLKTDWSTSPGGLSY